MKKSSFFITQHKLLPLCTKRKLVNHRTIDIHFTTKYTFNLMILTSESEVFEGQFFLNFSHIKYRYRRIF
jgi:hypothetical protein